MLSLGRCPPTTRRFPTRTAPGVDWRQASQALGSKPGGGGMKKNWFIPFFLLFLFGCSLTLNVEGRFEDTAERLVGTATGYSDGSGKIQLVNGKGIKITGTFVYINARQGAGTLVSSDGQAGKFTFVSTGERGTGAGDLNGRPFVFTFGPEPGSDSRVGSAPFKLRH